MNQFLSAPVTDAQRQRDALLGALVGLARSTVNEPKTEDTDRVLASGLRLAADPGAAEDALRRMYHIVETEKHRVAPNCAICTTVSYTHLSISAIGFGRKVHHAFPKPAVQIFRYRQVGNLLHRFRVKPVSYTHLDVYKRQMQKYVIALYIRLSIEDYKDDSRSIENQSLVLHEYAASMPEALNAEIMEFIDNGYSGTNFERPQVQKLTELVRTNEIDCIIVQDLSRFGRNSIETGYFIERVFPLFHTRFISISDDFDSSKFKGDTGGMDVAFKYLISEYYSLSLIHI